MSGQSANVRTSEPPIILYYLPVLPVPSLSVIDNKKILARDGIFCVVDEMDRQDGLSGFCLHAVGYDLTWDSKQLLLENALWHLNERVLLKIRSARSWDLLKQSSDRRTICLSMLDFYIYLGWIYCFATTTFQNFPSSSKEATTVWLSINLGLTVHVLFREALAT
jgi:hypothetical protein